MKWNKTKWNGRERKKNVDRAQKVSESTSEKIKFSKFNLVRTQFYILTHKTIIFREYNTCLANDNLFLTLTCLITQMDIFQSIVFFDDE